MLPVRIIFLSLVLVGGFICQTSARTVPPGTYHEEGRIVEKTDGQMAVFWGAYAYLFPKPLQEKLRPYLGKFVKIEYTRVADAPGRFSMLGSEIGDITKIDIEAEDSNHLPIVFKVKPTKPVYNLNEPVVVHVSVTNHTNKTQELGLGTGETMSLCQDYERILALDWLEEYYSDDAAWGIPKRFGQYPTLAAGRTLEFDITSQFMVRPGTYQIVYKATGGSASNSCNQSEVATISVAPAKDETAEHKSLLKWLYAAAYPQRVEIAEQLLLRFNDRSGTQEVLRVLGTGVYSKESHWEPAAFRHAWKYGGKAGEKVMLDLIESQKRQGVVDHLLEDIGWCPDHLMLLDELLACKNITFRDEDTWAGTPRICDITAAYLRGHPSDVKIKFPKLGTEEEWDLAVSEVQRTLKENPASLHMPAMTYSEERTLSEEKKINSSPN